MNWTELFSMQKKLDEYIVNTHELTTEKSLFQEKILALLVELGELANETRCFKFWSMKPRGARETILEEYVDGIHFLLSLGLEKNYRFESNLIEQTNRTEVEQFNRVFEACIDFNQNSTKSNYSQLFLSFLQLGQILGFNEMEIQEAYYKKNEVNFERQDRGY